ncbi:hypothetical protein Pyrde_0784 [Pyrodictium delaneyi]|uniref:Cytochrome c-552/4 domain-containing protein n=1 Tax=Pyrodictium delaneyi TaxID=1273541 RepID=A0A0P0N2Z7_9CREN|nr:multiheme c-type cytochrome [Pyrodictium delaneyi]ALL00834.1 hypothetical protein Pyrde_0784 [Pyrodictium delaneyi]OWJ55535.1 hypothetical protein Pdsh_01730 [Pyrodictium delaneyi]
MQKPLAKIVVFWVIALFLLPSIAPLARAATYSWGEEISLSGVQLTTESKDCVECHMRATPFIVYDWYKSKHRMVGVGCYECHSAKPGTRPDVYEHYGYYITTLVTPKQCGRCHPAIAEEFQKSVHAFAGVHAYVLKEEPAYWMILAKQFGWDEHFKVPAEYIETEWVPKIVRDFVGDQNYGKVVLEEDPTNAIIPYNPLGLSIDNYVAQKALYIWGIRGCLGCHGVRMDVKDAFAFPSLDELMQYMKEGKAPEKVVYDPAFMHNHGIGRVNPDGSLGSCEACHPYHGFSVKIARKGAYQACGRCHTGPDHPNDEQWSKSVHGAIFWGEAEDWDWDKPVNNWMPGRDYRAPTCVTCHMAAVFNERGEVKYASSHDVAIISKFKLGKWVYTLPRVAGLPDFAIPTATATQAPVFKSPTTGDTITLVYPEPDWKARRQRAIDMCAQCHTKEYAAAWLKTYDWMIILVDYMRDEYVLTVANMLKAKGLFTPMDEWMVRNLGAMANRPTKMSAAHFGPDFTWWEGIMHFAEKIEEWLIDVYERPAVAKKAPEIREKIEEILPWFKEQWEGEGSTGTVHSLAEVKTAIAKAVEAPSIEAYAQKVETLEPPAKPLVAKAPVKTLGEVSEFSLTLPGSDASREVPVAVFAVFPAAPLLLVFVSRKRAVAA